MSNGIALNLAEAGPADAPALILLHGFPEFWYGWRHQIDALAAAGFRVIVPDQRGYSLSGRPQGIAAYDLDLLAADIIGLADQMGRERIGIVGHDWGGLVTWWLASRHPHRIARFAALAAPHPAIWIDAMQNDPAQRRKSWYVQAFRLPWLPEFLMRQRGYKALADALRDGARPDACTGQDLAHYRAAWAKPGALTAMVNWYRAIVAKGLRRADAGPIDVPALVIWGNADRYGSKDLARRSLALCTRGEAVYLDTSHWVQHDAPQRVNELLIDFFKDMLAS